MRIPLIVGNWKMNGDQAFVNHFGSSFAQGYQTGWQVDTAICPSHCHLTLLNQQLSTTGCKLGAQHASPHANGAWTGETSLSMLKDLGCQYCIIGHSERRHLLGDTQAYITASVKACLDSQIHPIYCIGEQAHEREANTTFDVLKDQLQPILSLLSDNPSASITIAYEPVWAIGTGLSASPEQAQEVHQWIRKTIAQHHPNLAKPLRILYGGSVKSSNASDLIAMADIDGFLIGGASLEAQSLIEIITLCNSYYLSSIPSPA